MSFHAKSIVAIAAVALALSGVVVLPATAESSDYCSSSAGQQDPRCKPDYCATPQGQQDPWCFDPHYCERNPNDPICKKGPANDDKKDLCVWYVDGVPVGSLVPILRQSNPGPHVVRLDCPSHALKDWTCIAKSRESGPIPSTGQTEPECKYHGATVDSSTCAATHVWTVVVPEFNTWTVELSAVMYKVKHVADPTGLLGTCVGPVDWNTSSFGIGPDGKPVVKCLLENQYLAKDFLWKEGNTWYHYRFDGNGTYEYHTHPNLAQMPDGKIDQCDLQYYSIQWRQWN